jgi:hypothetical protein
MKMGNKAMAALKGVYGTEYEGGATPEILYPAAGKINIPFRIQQIGFFRKCNKYVEFTCNHQSVLKLRWKPRLG